LCCSVTTSSVEDQYHTRAVGLINNLYTFMSLVVRASVDIQPSGFIEGKIFVNSFEVY